MMKKLINLKNLMIGDMDKVRNQAIHDRARHKTMQPLDALFTEVTLELHPHSNKPKTTSEMYVAPMNFWHFDFLLILMLLLILLILLIYSVSYLISSKRLFFENIAHVGSFSVFVLVCKSIFWRDNSFPIAASYLLHSLPIFIHIGSQAFFCSHSQPISGWIELGWKSVCAPIL